MTEKKEDGHYVAASIGDDTVTALKKWCKENDLPVQDNVFDELHITICYSRKVFPFKKDELIEDLSKWRVKPVKFDVFGTEDTSKYLVLVVSCKKLTDRWQHYMDQGASFDFDDYVAHISLVKGYEGTKEDAKELDVGSLPKLVLKSEYYQPLDLSKWSSFAFNLL